MRRGAWPALEASRAARQLLLLPVWPIPQHPLSSTAARMTSLRRGPLSSYSDSRGSSNVSGARPVGCSAGAGAGAGLRSRPPPPLQPPPPPLSRTAATAAAAAAGFGPTSGACAYRSHGSKRTLQGPVAASSLGDSSCSASASTPAPAPPPPPPAAVAPGASVTSTAAAPQLPLCRRPAVHVDDLAAALAWKAHMARQISQLGNSLEQQDGGPDMADLMRELEWVLDDAIEACRPRADAPWEETSWRLLEHQVLAAKHRQQDLSGWQLRLREPLEQLWEWWERRLRDRVPFQYLISSAHWHTYVLSVGPGVLIPRPETEIFPELVRTAITARPYLAAAPWADLGTGSGAIAIAAADELRRRNPSAQVWAVDLSPAAAAYARFNADQCLAADGGGGTDGGGCHVRVVQGSWFEPVRHLRGRLGGVLSNPPYIPRVQMAALQAEVGEHEPSGALDGGEGPGLDSLRELCAEAAAMLASGGLLALETAGGEQADLVADMLRAAGISARSTDAAESGSRERGSGTAEVAAFEEVEVLEDCYGVRRFVRAYRRGGGGGGNGGER